MAQHIQLKRLESRKWNCVVLVDGVAQSLTSCTITFTVRNTLTSTNSGTLFQCTASNGGILITGTTSGQYQLVVGSTATESVSKSAQAQRYYFDHRLQLPSGAIKVLEQGDFIVEPNVTEAMA